MTAEVTAGAPGSGIGRKQWRTIILSSLGGALEFYDFVVYSMFAKYIGAAFFPSERPLESLLKSFVVFAVGYFARPLGGIILSHFGDRFGRRRVFIGAMLVMSLSTVCMGLLPSYATWGTTASVLMVCLRLLQGFCLGGELPGAITYVVETAPKTAGFATGFIFFCVNSGVLLAALLNLVVTHTLDQPQLVQYGWRIGFLVGGALGFISFYLRLSLEETREFQLLKQGGRARVPFFELLRTQPGSILVAIASMVATAAFNGLLFAMPAFLPQAMHYGDGEASLAQNVCLFILSFGLLGTAWLGDRIPRRWILAFGSLLFVVLSVPFFEAVNNRSFGLLWLFAGAGVAASFINGPMCATAADLFPTRIRFSGVAVSFNLAFSIFSGIAPLVATALVQATGSPASPGWYMSGSALICLIGALLLQRYDGRILREQQERALAAAADHPAQTSSFPAQ
jgi:MFS transporter, MHS family, proline/betaine transporter